MSDADIVPVPEHVHAELAALRAARLEQFPSPHYASSDDGEIGMAWSSPRGRVHVILHPERVTVLIGRIDGVALPGTEAPFGSGWPPGTLEALSRLYAPTPTQEDRP